MLKLGKGGNFFIMINAMKMKNLKEISVHSKNFPLR